MSIADRILSRRVYSTTTPPTVGTTIASGGRRYRVTRLLGPALVEGYSGGIVGASWIVYGRSLGFCTYEPNPPSCGTQGICRNCMGTPQEHAA